MKRTLALIGGGHAHVEVLRQLALNPPVDADVALFNPSPSVWYSGMLPGVIAGHYTANDAKVNLWALCQQARVRFFETSINSLSAETRRWRPRMASVIISTTPHWIWAVCRTRSRRHRARMWSR